MLPHTQKSFCGQMDKNEHSSTGAKVAYNCFSDLYFFFRVSNKKKCFAGARCVKFLGQMLICWETPKNEGQCI